MRLSAVLLLVLVCLMIFTFHDVNGENHHKKGAGHKDMSPHRNHGPSPGGKDSMMPVKPSKGHHNGHKHKHSSKDRHRSPSAASKHHKNKHHDKKKHPKKPHGHKKDHRSSD